jgi:hypothetical protein
MSGEIERDDAVEGVVLGLPDFKATDPETNAGLTLGDIRQLLAEWTEEADKRDAIVRRSAPLGPSHMINAEAAAVFRACFMALAAKVAQHAISEMIAHADVAHPQ